MSNRVKERQRAAARAATGLPSKAERRQLGKQAAARRAAARRRRKVLKNAGVVVVGLAVVAVIAFAFGAFSPSSSSTPQASASPSASVSLNPALGTKPVVTKGTGTLSELKVTTLIEGTGAPVVAGQTISVNYVGVTYATGEEFDASWTGGQPISFVIGQGRVIKGWDQGLVGVKIGSRVQLDIPADLAYGEKPAGDQPAGALRFVVDILSAT